MVEPSDDSEIMVGRLGILANLAAMQQSLSPSRPLKAAGAVILLKMDASCHELLRVIGPPRPVSTSQHDLRFPRHESWILESLRVQRMF
jgi:hypothetical protein